MTMNNTYKVLQSARRQERWVLTETLAPYGLHSTLLHSMEDNGHIITSMTPHGKAIKLTAKGFKYATQLLTQEEGN